MERLEKALQISAYTIAITFLLSASVCIAIGTYMFAAFAFLGVVWNLS